MRGENNRNTDEPLEPLILALRGQRVILDTDLARIYGVSTKALNQAVKRNSSRFPIDFSFHLSAEEISNLKSQFVTSNRISTTNQGYAKNRSALMAANVLRSKRAVQMSIFVIRAFVRLREHITANAAILKRLAEIDQTLLRHDTALRDVYRKLQPLLAPPTEPQKRRIGF